MRTSLALSVVASLSATMHASIVTTTDPEEWFGTAGPVTALDFTDLALSEFVTDQYTHLGVTFFGTAIGHQASYFQTDGHGILGWTHPLIELEFHAARTEFAIEIASFTMEVHLYLGDSAIGSVNVSSQSGKFRGFTLSEPFDRVHLISQTVTGIDNLYFGAPIPAPAALVLVAFAGLVTRRRRGA